MSMSPMLRGLLSGLQSGLSFYAQTSQMQQQQQRELEEKKALEQWKLDHEPAPTRTITTTDDSGVVHKIGQEFVRPKGDTPSSWNQISDEIVPKQLQQVTTYGTDANGNPTKGSSLIDGSGNTVKDLGSAPEFDPQRLTIAKLNNETRESIAGSRGGGQGKLIRQVDDDGNAIYGTVKDGVFSPVQDELGNPVSSRAWRQRQRVANTMTLNDGSKLKMHAADAIGPASPASPFDDRPALDDMPESKASPQVTFVDPSTGQGGGALSQLASGGLTPVSPPTPGAAAPKPAAKSPYPDGTHLVGPNGQKYIVHNGVPVPDGM